MCREMGWPCSALHTGVSSQVGGNCAGCTCSSHTGRDFAGNLDLVEKFARKAKEGGAEMVVFPEATMRAFGNSLLDIAEPLDGPWASRVRDIAAELGIVIVAGMFTPGPARRAGKVRNTLAGHRSRRGSELRQDPPLRRLRLCRIGHRGCRHRPVTFELRRHRFRAGHLLRHPVPGAVHGQRRPGAEVNIVCASWGSGPGKVDSGSCWPGPAPWTPHVCPRLRPGRSGHPGRRGQGLGAHRRGALRRRLPVR